MLTGIKVGQKQDKHCVAEDIKTVPLHVEFIEPTIQTIHSGGSSTVR